jgi:hypothetical protein
MLTEEEFGNKNLEMLMVVLQYVEEKEVLSGMN